MQSYLAQNLEALEALHVLRHKEATVNAARLRELCDAADVGALRGEELRELVALAREACDTLAPLDQCAECDGRGEYETDHCALCEAPLYTFCDACAGTGKQL